MVVNQRLVYRVQPLTTDSPTSTLIVFDVAKKQMLRSAPITITKAARSVAVLTTGDFLVASDGPISRVQVHIQPGPTQYICSSDSEDKGKAGGFKVGEKVEILRVGQIFRDSWAGQQKVGEATDRIEGRASQSLIHIPRLNP